MKNNVLETEPFSLPTGKYVKSILMMFLSDWWWGIVLLMLSCVLLATLANVLFIYVGLIILFILFPSALMYIYFYYSTTQEARIAILSKIIKIEETRIVIEFEPIVYNHDDDKGIEKTVVPKPIYISNTDVRNVENMGSYIRIFLKGGKYKFITIPFEKVKGIQDEFLAHVLRYNDKSNI